MMPGTSKGARTMASAIVSQIFSKTPELTTFEESETQAYTLEDVCKTKQKTLQEREPLKIQRHSRDSCMGATLEFRPNWFKSA